MKAYRDAKKVAPKRKASNEKIEIILSIYLGIYELISYLETFYLNINYYYLI